MKIGIVIFPGSNCERDCADAVTETMGAQVVSLWHREADLHGVDAIILPGGFSYGDYLRAGALARLSPIMTSVKAFAEQGRPVIGICNGFQILTEAHMLPGCLVKNSSLRFYCETVSMRVENTQTMFTQCYLPGQMIQMPVAHAEGNYVVDADTLKSLEDKQQVLFRYENDINGAMNRIAGICNEKKNVLGMMPHPERNLWKRSHWTGEGAPVFDGLKQQLMPLLSAAVS